MKKTIAAATLITAIGTVSPSAFQYATSRHPTVTEVDKGWEFNYELCHPMPPPLECIYGPFKIFVPKGTTPSPGRPYAKRLVSIDTAEQARGEAEQLADIEENIQPNETKWQKIKRFWHIYRKRKMTDN